MKNISKCRLSLIYVVSIIFLLLISCSSEKSNDTKTETTAEIETVETTPKKELLTVKDTIEANLSEAMERLRYWDNSGLYENEFAYLTDETSFDEYLKFGQISYRNQKTVIDLIVDSLNLFAHDSAETWVTITLENPDGTTENMSEQILMAYYQKGRWIKPTVSVIKFQAEYDELIRQAEEASKWEDEE